MNPVNWIKQHKVLSVIIALFLFLIFKNNISQIFYAFQYRNRNMELTSEPYNTDRGIGSYGVALPSNSSAPYYPSTTKESVNIGATDRKVIEESNLSLQVKDVPQTQKSVKAEAERLGGFMVLSTLVRPEESANGTITVRVPSDKASEMLDFLRKQAVKVVSENLTGYDVTDRYSDLEAKISTLNSTKTRFIEIMNKAVDVQDILNVQREIFNLQDQIDSYKGQLDYLAKTSSSVKISINLATDQFALPYAPTTSWKPSAIIKEAVRSLVLDLRGLATKFIWIVIYSPIWLTALAIFLVVKKRFFTKK